MKRRLWGKVLAALLVGAITFTSVVPASVVKAAEEQQENSEGSEGDENNENSGGLMLMQNNDDGQDGDITFTMVDVPELRYNYALAVSNNNVSLGQIAEDSDYFGASAYVDVINKSDVGANIIWSEYDPYDVFGVDVDGSTYVDVNGKVRFYFSPDGVLSPGKYTGSVMFSTQEDQSKTVAVNLSMTVVPGSPIVYDVDVSPSYAEVSKGGNVQFRASADGHNMKNLGFTWKVLNNNSSNTKISGDGYLTVGSDETSDTIVITAISKDDNETSGIARVSIKNNYYNISAHAEEGGQVSGGGSVTGGSSVELLASPNNGYDFEGWYENGKKISTDKKIRIDNVNSDRSFTARFTRRLAYVITSSAPDNAGTTSGDGYFNVGDKVTVKAKEKDGYRFVCWKMGDQTVSKEKEYTITNLNGEYRLTACFEKIEFNVKVAVTPDGAGQIDGVSKYALNEKAVLKAYAANGYTFKGWFSDSKLITDKDTYTIDKVTKDYCLVAVFEKKAAKSYIMTSKSGKGGKIVPEGSYPVVEGVNVTYLITPDAGYKIADVVADGKSLGPVSSFVFPKVASNHEISVAFARSEDKKNEKTNNHGNNGVQNVVVKPTNGSVSDAKKEQQQNTKTEAEKEEIASDIQEANEDINYDNLTGLLQKYNMTPDEAYMHLYDEVGQAMFAEAYRDGTITFVMNNDYAPNTQATATNEFFSDPSMPNYMEVIDECITEEEAIGVLKGNKLNLHVDITDMTQLLSTTEKKQIFSYAEENGLTVGNVFDITLLRTYHDVMSNIKELDIDAEFVMMVPEELLSESQEFKIIHIHDDGSREILDDLDDDPTTVTFKTRSFSNFAFAYAGGEQGTVSDITNDSADNAKSNNVNKIIIIVVAVLSAVLLTLILLLILSKGSKKNKRRR